MKIAIDGPSGAGKSTISKILAKRLNFIYIDTGAMFRTIALFSLNNNIDLIDKKKIVPYLDKISIDIKYENEIQKMFLNGEEVTGKIRTPEVSKAASDIATIPEVREKLLLMQRKMSENNNVIMDGRDIATKVLPDAEIKIFLTASPEARAERRLKELLEKGVNTTFEDVLNDMKFRDKQDSEREFAPLKITEDSVVFDTSNLTFDESVEVLYSHITGVIGK